MMCGREAASTIAVLMMLSRVKDRWLRHQPYRHIIYSGASVLAVAVDTVVYSIATAMYARAFLSYYPLMQSNVSFVLSPSTSYPIINR